MDRHMSGAIGPAHYTRACSDEEDGQSSTPTISPQEPSMRLAIGSVAPAFSAETIGGRRVSLEQLRGRPLLLKFYRFATCPVCNLHMHQFIQEHDQVAAAGLTTVVFYHSPADKLAGAQREAAPFDLVPDPKKRTFRDYGVETGLRGFVSPAVMRDYARAMLAGYPPGLFTSDGGMIGNPADFIVDASGRIAMARYGKHYADSLDAQDVVRVWRAIERRTAMDREGLIVAVS
jgi:peroxiredoxin